MKKEKSLRQLATELGVSHSYLSQVLHGKRPASEKVVSILEGRTEANSGLQIRLGGNLLSSVGSTPMRSRQKTSRI